MTSNNSDRFVLAQGRKYKIDWLKELLNDGKYDVYFGVVRILLNYPISEGGIESEVIDALYQEHLNQSPPRVAALAWWRSLDDSTQQHIQSYHYPDDDFVVTDKSSTRIEAMWNWEINKKCKACGQTTENCECHIPHKDKHKGLCQLINNELKWKKS